MTNNPHNHSFVSTSHCTNIPNSGRSHVCSLSQHTYSPPQVHKDSVMHLSYPAGMQDLAYQESNLLPTLEFRVPLLADNAHLVPDFQQRAVAVSSGIPARRQSLYDRHSTDHLKRKASAAHAAVSATHSVPFTLPVAIPYPSFTRLNRASPAPLNIGPLERAPTSCLERIITKSETPTLRLQDLCYMDDDDDDERAYSPSFARAKSHTSELALPPSPSYPPPSIAQNSPNLLIPPRSSDSDSSKEFHYATFGTPPSLSIPSLSDDSLSSVENGTQISGKEFTSDADGLRLSLSPLPFTLKMDYDDPGYSPMFGIIVDINMREQALRESSPKFYINPAEVMAGFHHPSPERTKLHEDWEMEIPQSPRALGSMQPAGPSATCTGRLSPVTDCTENVPEEVIINETFPDEAISAIVSVLKSTSTPDTTSTPSTTLCQSREVVAPQPVYASPSKTFAGSDFGLLHPPLPDYVRRPSNSKSGNTSGNRLPLRELRAPQQHTAQTYVPYPPTTTYAGVPTYVFSSAPAQQQEQFQPQSVDAPRPVLNAHVGITLEELRQRATEYRARHPSAELDKTFLQSFAGRLSSHGELLDDYRCYVVGCGQRNKRRDHILVHVGSHVEHRPWACQHCGMKFLRKNECKRHESSHEGRKPFSCEICAPFQDRSFVRQDLLKRHLRVSHGMHSTSRKKTTYKAAEDLNDWP